MAVKKDKEKEREQELGVATLALRSLINPPEDKLAEVCFLPLGAVHSLTMLQAYENHLDNLLEQVRDMKLYYLRRKLKRDVFNHLITTEAAFQQLEDERDKVNTEETIELKKLFIHYFRMSYYQHSRGKEGKFAEQVVMLADTDMQTRNPDLDEALGRGSRSQ